MRCPICKQEIKDNSKFCGKCGNIVPRCPSCGKVIDKKVRFCIYDGTPLSAEITSMLPQEVKQEINLPKKKKKMVLPILLSVFVLLIAGALVTIYILYNSGKIDFFNNKEDVSQNEEYKDRALEDEDTSEEIGNDTETIDEKEVENFEELAEDVNTEAGTALKVDVAEEVLKIREKYNDIVEKINADRYEKRVYANGMTAYFEQGKVKAINILGNVDGTVYKRFFYYDVDGLFFAYYEADDAHRLYFLNEELIRWRYSADAEDAQNAENHDLENTSEYDYWSMFAINESDYYLQMAFNNETMTDRDYILEGSERRYLTKDELVGMNAEECRLARNELYARHGRMFDDEFLKKYFEQKDWYSGTISSENFTEDMLNEYEVYNRNLIVEYEKDMGYR